MSIKKVNLLDLNREGLRAFFVELGEKPFRAEQVMKWIYHFGCDDFDLMSNINKKLREKLKNRAEIVAPEVISRDPNRVITPGFRVSAVVNQPWGAHPSPVPGFYNRDHQAFIDYRNESKTPELFTSWRNRWVDSVHSSRAYLNLLGEERITALALTHHDLSEPVDYGY